MRNKPGENIRRNVLIDSSSTILLFKSGLLENVIKYYKIIMIETVFDELTRYTYAGAYEIKQYLDNQLIQVILKSGMREPVVGDTIVSTSLDRGEQDAIIAYREGAGDFIIIDDGKGAGYCLKHDIPYINALLVPCILRLAGIISEQEFEIATSDTIGYGRYSEKIIEFARSCSDEDLINFM